MQEQKKMDAYQCACFFYCPCPYLAFHIQDSFFLPSLLLLSIELKPVRSSSLRGCSFVCHEDSRSGVESLTNALQICQYLLAIALIRRWVPSRSPWLLVCWHCPHMWRPFDLYIIECMRTRLRRSLRVSSAWVSRSCHSYLRKVIKCFSRSADGSNSSIFWTATGFPPPCWSVQVQIMAIDGIYRCWISIQASILLRSEFDCSSTLACWRLVECDPRLAMSRARWCLY